MNIFAIIQTDKAIRMVANITRNFGKPVLSDRIGPSLAPPKAAAAKGSASQMWKGSPPSRCPINPGMADRPLKVEVMPMAIRIGHPNKSTNNGSTKSPPPTPIIPATKPTRATVGMTKRDTRY